MKITLKTLFLLSLPFFGYTQTPESTVVMMEIDSMISINQNWVDQQQFDEAFGLIELAKAKAESFFGKNHIAYVSTVLTQAYTFYRFGDFAKAESLFLGHLPKCPYSPHRQDSNL